MSKTKLLLTGIVSAAVMVGAAGCSSNQTSQTSRPSMPNDASCKEWEWDHDDGVWECDDRSSGHYGSSYHGGRYYSSKSDLRQSSSYQNSKSSSSFKGGSSGFGTGSKGGFGG